MSGWAGLACLLLAAAAGAQEGPLLQRPNNAAEPADFGRPYGGTVSRDVERLYAFNYTSKPGQVMFVSQAEAPESHVPIQPGGGEGVSVVLNLWMDESLLNAVVKMIRENNVCCPDLKVGYKD
ncbi:UNVERIFIED_CONTAM: hypothetical protein K2H54_019933 [Gekko kuhli]